jgi:hypothetical protein
MKVELSTIKRIAAEIKADQEWVNDSHTSAEHQGIKSGLDMLISHLEHTQEIKTSWFHKADKHIKNGYWYVKLTDIKFG